MSEGDQEAGGSRPDDERSRRVENIVLVTMFILLCAGGTWLLLAMADAKKAQDCLSQGRRNCAPVTHTDRTPQ